MRPMIPRVAAIHDLSGFGRSSLCNVLPILSTMGIQACPVPTAVLSTHSGGFDGYIFRDLTEEEKEIVYHGPAEKRHIFYKAKNSNDAAAGTAPHLPHSGHLGGDRPGDGRWRAVQFISQCIKASDSYEYPRREGVLLERELPLLHTTTLIGSYEEF